MSIIHSHRKNLAYLTLKLKLEELNLYENVILTIKDTERRESLLTFVEDKRKFLTEKYFIFKEKIQKQMYLTLRRKLRKYMLKPFKKFTPQGEKKIAFSNSLVFLLKNRRYKKQRAMQIPRLKHVH